MIRRVAAMVVVGGALVATAPDAVASHDVHRFDRAAFPAMGTEGFAGMFFTGSPRWQGWDCSACHQGDATVRLQITSEPPDLVATGAYHPGATYAVTLRLLGEHRGLTAIDNVNSVMIDVVDDAGRGLPVWGDREGVTLFVDRTVAGTYLALNGVPGNVRTLVLAAPPAGTGPITLYASAVDGNGGDKRSDEDPRPPVDVWDDDYANLVVRLCERVAPCDDPPTPAPPPESPADANAGCAATPSTGPGALPVVLVLIAARRRPRP